MQSLLKCQLLIEAHSLPPYLMLKVPALLNPITQLYFFHSTFPLTCCVIYLLFRQNVRHCEWHRFLLVLCTYPQILGAWRIVDAQQVLEYYSALINVKV